ncbi:MAG TPA: Ig domain-containing protein, partial [Opitutales bacterium]|nr:Ig domain-containing protein [Opitutales bacterium]
MFLCSVIAMGLSAAPNDPARVEVGLVQAAEYNPPIGANEFGDPGGTAFSAGNLIPDSGFEPISMRKRFRVARTGVEGGRVWFEVDGGGGMSQWELTGMGLMNGAAVRIYRIVDSNGQPLPQNVSDNYLDLTGAAAYVRVGTSTVPEAGTSGLPFGGWVDTIYAQPSSLYGTRANLDFTDAFWVENGHTYHYIVTAIGSNTNEAGGENESDPATAVEVSATPDGGLSGAPRVYSSSGSGLNGIGQAVQGSWFSFQARVAGAEGSVSWQLLDENNQVIAPPAGLTFDSTTGTLSGEPTSTPSPTLLRFRATASNGVGSRDFVLNQPAWVPTGGSERPQPPLNVSAVAGNGHVYLSWNASPTPGVVGYRIYRSEAPRSQQRQRIYLAEGAPALVKDDYVHL